MLIIFGLMLRALIWPLSVHWCEIKTVSRQFCSLIGLSFQVTFKDQQSFPWSYCTCFRVRCISWVAIVPCWEAPYFWTHFQTRDLSVSITFPYTTFWVSTVMLLFQIIFYLTRIVSFMCFTYMKRTILSVLIAFLQTIWEI